MTAQPIGFSTQTALLNYDILAYIFNSFESRSRGSGRKALAACTLVCQTWSEPASEVLWRKLDSLHPLWALLAGRYFPPSAKRLTEFWTIVEPEEFVKEVAAKEPDLWKRFLHRASHIREIGTASYGEAELALIRSVVQHNGGTTFLPSLNILAWRHAVTTDMTLLVVISPSLRSLELSTARNISRHNGMHPPPNDYTPSEPLFAGLPAAAPYLHRLVISGRQLPSSIVYPHIVGLTRLRELCLYNDLCAVRPADLCLILGALPDLELLSTQVKDFFNPPCAASSTSLRELRLNGTPADLAGVLSPSGIDVPFLTSLSLNVDGVAYTASHQHCLEALALANFAPTLRTLVLATVVRDEQIPADAELAHYTTLIGPLMRLAHLEDVELRILNTWLNLADEDVLAVARAWRRLRRLILSYIPTDSVPSMTVLRHFAMHCPDLRELVLTKVRIPEALDVPAPVIAETLTTKLPAKAGSEKALHPLRKLDLRLTFATRDPINTLEVARFIDSLFPQLEVTATRSGRITVFTAPWEKIEAEIRRMRTRRSLGVQM
ncbi:hypothetical protein GY45DRAFT_82424 [Cubamyces sp. BRFM 1775]|nr:hypothetical protein GY45DRAFT_82424 [Cubamyces sp. BRFM 1775]